MRAAAKRHAAGGEVSRLEGRDSTLCNRLHARFTTEDWNLLSAAGQKVARHCYTLARLLPIPLVYYGYTGEMPVVALPQGI